MFISKVSLVNYRNFANASFIFKKGINTIIGENGSGKTNVFRAIRLLLESASLQYAYKLNETDFNRNLGKDNWKGHWIIISIEFDEINNEEAIQSLFIHGAGIAEKDFVTKASYNLFFRPKADIRQKLSELKEGDKVGLEKILDSLTIKDNYETFFTGKSTADFNDPKAYKELVGLFTGGRREEIVELKWSGVKLHDDGTFSHIEINHFKINRQNSDVVSDKEYEIKEFVITKELGNLLLELGYEKYKDTDKYILAPEESLSRKTMMDYISASFSIFYSKLNNGKVRLFKHLRKTYISSAVAQFGTSATALTIHTKFDIIKENYLDKAVLRKAQKDFSVFGNSSDSVPQNSTTPN